MNQKDTCSRHQNWNESLSKELAGFISDTYSDRWVDLLNVGLLNQNFFRKIAQIAHFWFLDVFTSAQLFNLSVDSFHVFLLYLFDDSFN